MDIKAFRKALGAYPTGVTVVTTQTERGPLGFTANSFASLSLEPPLVLWSPARASARFEAFSTAERFTIHILAAAQKDLAGDFAKSGDTPFATTPWIKGETGPEFEGAAAVLRCHRAGGFPGGDHEIVIGQVMSFEHDAALEPLVFHRGDFPSLR